MKTIAITRGLTVSVDDDVYEWASRHRWFAGNGNAGKWYAARSVRRDGKKTTLYLHRVIAGIEGLEVDHIDGNSLNNVRANLRPLTHAKNVQATNKANATSKTGFRGVTQPWPNSRFQAYIWPKGGKREVLGYFDTAEEAARAAAAARAERFSL